MKGIICYYSGSGNTKLAATYLSKKIKNADFVLHNILKDNVPDLGKYDIIGFATFTDFGAPSACFYSFSERIDSQKGKYAFVLNTYGSISFNTLFLMKELAESKKLQVIGGHSLHTPESYPPMRRRRLSFDGSPGKREMAAFNRFICRLDQQIESGGKPNIYTIKPSPYSHLFRGYARDKAKRDFGIQQVLVAKCSECGTCALLCPYHAIELSPKPVFDHDKCKGCWSCYNHCSNKAIYTRKFKGEFQYAKPNERIKKKLSIA